MGGLIVTTSCGNTEEKTEENTDETTTEEVKTTAEEVTESFKVLGNCEMCKDRIEKAATGVEGVSTAAWSSEKQNIEITFDKSKTDADKVQLAIAAVGHDTEKHKATDKVYEELAGCCKYDRTGETVNTHDHDHEGHEH